MNRETHSPALSSRAALYEMMPITSDDTVGYRLDSRGSHRVVIETEVVSDYLAVVRNGTRGVVDENASTTCLLNRSKTSVYRRLLYHLP